MNGKPAHTDFKRLHYDRETGRSLVLCLPKTGKMHQIRVHLAHSGHPITNDPIYSRENWAKKSTEEFSKELTEVLFRKDNVSRLLGGEQNGSSTDESELHSAGKDEDPSNGIRSGSPDEQTTSLHQTPPDVAASPTNPDPVRSSDSNQSVSGDGIKQAADITLTPDGKFCLDGRVFDRIPRLSYDENCPECSWIRLVPASEDMFIFLHAVRYELDEKVYVSPLPEWCPEEWIPAEFHDLLQIT